ncbi:TlpA family protein disulfide reductase [Streptomyces cahuitamycinicus]|uniref:Thioredoxin domain-containing protein n=1 Tax=Streptomyces cahuitamycinicus TaxID=2070367 RepID=A0A2N8TN45_9ACTN|nr:hypothetical protein [Streptomyces cahuitamycinicus]PNG20444.1 hypothetical protein C1J00_20205 [Streptomyces cahuitamycinicus]
MPYLIAAVVLVGVLCALDLVLTLGVVKRLREHTQLIAGVRDAGRTCKGVGEEIGEFAVTTVEGEPLTREALGADTLVAFFSPTCRPCKEKLPQFVEYARTVPGGRDRVVAAVVGDLDVNTEMVDTLRSVARVVVEKNNEEPLGTAFGVMGFPSVVRVAPDRNGRPVVEQDRVELLPVVA